MHSNHANESTPVVDVLLEAEWLANTSLLKLIHRDIGICKLTFSIIFKTDIGKVTPEKVSKIQNDLEVPACNPGKEDKHL